MSFLFPIVYSAALTYLVWKAFKVMSNGWGALDKQTNRSYKTNIKQKKYTCLLYTSPSPRDLSTSRMPSSA